MNHHIGYLIKSINDKLKIKADEDLKSHNLTLSQSRIVLLLSKKHGGATQKDIEDELGVSHPTVVGLVSRMEQNGIVYTFFDNKSRSKIVKLTEQAIPLSKDMEETISKNENEMLNGLSDSEIEQIEKSLKIILKNLSK